MTRATFAVTIQQRFSLPPPSHLLSFPDVSASDSIYTAVEATAPLMNEQVLCPRCQLSLNFSPNEEISRVVALITLLRILVANDKLQILSAAEADTVLANVSDAKTLIRSARLYLATALKNGIVHLGSDNAIQATAPYTQEELTAALNVIQAQFNLPPVQLQ